MKRSTMIKVIGLGLKLTGNQYTDGGRDLQDAGMLPPGYMKPIPFESDGKQYPLIPGDFKYNGVWCTPGVNEWEPEE